MISITIPIHGRRETTARFLASFDRQSRTCPLRFVDDQSPDDSVEWLRARGRTVEVPPRRLWFNGILNAAIAECQTPVLGFLNNDLVLGRRFVELAEEAFQKTDYDILVPCTTPTLDQDDLDAGRRFRVATLWTREGWCMLFRTARVRQLPPVPGDLKLYYGDTWLFHHAWRNGMKVGVMLHNRVFHEMSVTIKTGQGQGQPHPDIVADQNVYRAKYAWVGKHRDLGWIRLIPRPLRRLLLPYY